MFRVLTPNSVEFRIWPDPNLQSINDVQNSFSQSLWQVNNELGIVLHRSHSLTKKLNGQPEGHTEFGHFELIMSQSRIATSATITGDGYSRASTAKAKIFSKDNNKENGTGWWTICLNRTAETNYHSSSNFGYKLTAIQSNFGTIDQIVSASINVTASGTGQGTDGGFVSSSINNSWSGSLDGSKRAYFGGFVTSSHSSSYNESMHGLFGDTFNGSMQELRYYASPLNLDTIKDHNLAPQMYSFNTGTDTQDQLLLRLSLTENKNHWSGSAGLSSNSASVDILSTHPLQEKLKYWDSTNNFIVSGTAFNFHNDKAYGFVDIDTFIDTPELGPNNYTSNKIRVEENRLMRHLSSEGRAEKPSSDKFALDSNKLGIYFSPTDQVNSDIFNHIGGQQLDNFIGNPREAFNDRYEELRILNNDYWKKYTDDNNKATYLNELKQYDMSMFTLIKRYLPARANADVGVVIEPHFLERSKVKSRGKVSISGDTKAQNIALDADSFRRAAAPTNISCGKPEVAQSGFTLEPQTTTGNVAPKAAPAAGGNSLLKMTSAPQQYVPAPVTHQPNTTAIQAQVKTAIDKPLILLSTQTAQSLGKGNQIIQVNASNVVSHQTNSPLADIGGTIIVGNQVTGTPYSFNSLFKSGSGAAQKYIEVTTPDYKVSASITHICDYTLSELRRVNKYFYRGNGTKAHAIKSASFGKHFEDGGSVNRFAFSKSLKEAQVSDFNLANRNYQGTQISAKDFNIVSDDGSGEPVVSFTIGDPNQIISSDPTFEGTLKIE